MFKCIIEVCLILNPSIEWENPIKIFFYLKIDCFQSSLFDEKIKLVLKLLLNNKLTINLTLGLPNKVNTLGTIIFVPLTAQLSPFQGALVCVLDGVDTVVTSFSIQVHSRGFDVWCWEKKGKKMGIGGNVFVSTLCVRGLR